MGITDTSLDFGGECQPQVKTTITPIKRSGDKFCLDDNPVGIRLTYPIIGMVSKTVIIDYRGADINIPLSVILSLPRLGDVLNEISEDDFTSKLKTGELYIVTELQRATVTTRGLISTALQLNAVAVHLVK